MAKKIIYAIIALAVLFAAYIGLGYYRSRQAEKAVPASDDAEIIFFYGKTCPHCEIVEEYLDKENVRSRVDFSEREVYDDPSSARLMMDRQKECGLDKEYVGAVPFLWTKDKCYVGQDDIIRFFKDRIGDASDQGTSADANQQ